MAIALTSLLPPLSTLVLGTKTAKSLNVSVNCATVVIPFSFKLKHYLCEVYSAFIHLFILLIAYSFNKFESLLCADQSVSICLPQ